MIKEDKSMKEIHKIMEDLHNKRAKMSTEEIIKEMKEGAEKVKREHDVKLRRPTPPTPGIMATTMHAATVVHLCRGVQIAHYLIIPSVMPISATSPCAPSPSAHPRAHSHSRSGPISFHRGRQNPWPRPQGESHHGRPNPNNKACLARKQRLFL